MDCPNKNKIKRSKVLTVTQSDSKKKEESDNDDESENFTAFMTSAVEVTKISSKASKTKNSYESDVTI